MLNLLLISLALWIVVLLYNSDDYNGLIIHIKLGYVVWYLSKNWAILSANLFQYEKPCYCKNAFITGL